MPTTDPIDAAFEQHFNGLAYEERAAFRKGWELATERAIALVEKYKADPLNYYCQSGANSSFDNGVRSACSGILSDLSE